MRLLISRHGNTFNANTKPVWTGSSNDLPLVAKGIEQATKLGEYLKANDIKPAAVYASNLQRTYNYAAQALKVAELNNDIIKTKALDEIDYGSWTGLTDKQVIDKYGQQHLLNWRNKSIFPPAPQWDENELQVKQRIANFIDYLKNKHNPNDTILIITSNGIIRYFLQTVPNKFEELVSQNNISIKTGNISQIDIGDINTLEVWNQTPSSTL